MAAVGSSVRLQCVCKNRMADRRAIKIGNACLAFRVKYQRYPHRLDELVPEISSVRARRKNTRWGGDHFSISARAFRTRTHALL